MAAANKEFIMSKIDYRDPDSLPPAIRSVYAVLKDTFRNISVLDGWSPMETNAFVVGMCHTSMEDLLGKEEAIKTDLAWRKNIDWTTEQEQVSHRVHTSGTATERDRLKAANVELVAALVAFMEAKASVGANSYDGVDQHTRDLLEYADVQAALALAKAKESTS